MNALSAAKRLSLLLVSLLLILAATAAIAKDDNHGYLGVMLQNVSSSMAKALQLDEDEGVMINEVIEDGPAAKAGLEDGDVILKFNGKAIDSHKDLTKAVRKTAPGDLVDVEILHNGTRQTAQIEMGEARAKTYTYTINTDSDAPHAEFFGEGGEHKVIVMSGGDHGGEHGNVWFSDDDDDVNVEVIMDSLYMDGDRGFMGVELDDLNEQLGEYFGVDDGEGALISKVRDNSPAAEAGLKAGDVIVSVNGESVEDAGEVHEAMADTEPEQEIEVNIIRKGKTKTLKVVLGEMPDDEFVFDFDMPHMPKMMKYKEHRFPGGMKHDIRMVAPHRGHEMHEIIRIHEDRDDLSEVREELDELKKELKELQEELKK